MIEVKHRAAHVSPDGIYRWWLSRRWGDAAKGVMWIGLNPSTADDRKDDNTIRRMVALSASWGYSYLYVCNVFPYRATDPRELTTPLAQLRGIRGAGQNLGVLHDTRQKCSEVVCAWGSSKLVTAQDEHDIHRVVGGSGLFCCGHTQSMAPKHPLYLPNDTRLVAWSPHR